MKNNIWSVTILSGSHCINHPSLTKEQAKELFAKLAADATRGINNDINIMVMGYMYKKFPATPAAMRRVREGEYIYTFGKKSTRDAREAHQLIQRL